MYQVDSESFRGDYMRELNDAMLMMYPLPIRLDLALVLPRIPWSI